MRIYLPPPCRVVLLRVISQVKSNRRRRREKQKEYYAGLLRVSVSVLVFGAGPDPVSSRLVSLYISILLLSS